MDLPRASIARRLRKFRSPLPGSSLSVTELREVFEQLVATTWKETMADHQRDPEPALSPG